MLVIVSVVLLVRLWYVVVCLSVSLVCIVVCRYLFVYHGNRRSSTPGLHTKILLRSFSVLSRTPVMQWAVCLFFPSLWHAAVSRPSSACDGSGYALLAPMRWPPTIIISVILICMCIWMYICVYTHIYIYIYTLRERERDIHMHMHIHIHVHVYVVRMQLMILYSMCCVHGLSGCLKL